MQPPNDTSLLETRRMTYRSLKSVHWCDQCARLRNQKRKTKNSNSGKLGIRPDHPRRRIDMQFCVVGGLWVIVLSFKFDQNRLSGYRDFRGENLNSCISLANGWYSPVLPHRRDTESHCLTPNLINVSISCWPSVAVIRFLFVLAAI